MSLLLDIDAFRARSFTPDDPELPAAFEQLRELKMKFSSQVLLKRPRRCTHDNHSNADRKHSRVRINAAASTAQSEPAERLAEMHKIRRELLKSWVIGEGLNRCSRTWRRLEWKRRPKDGMAMEPCL